MNSNKLKTLSSRHTIRKSHSAHLSRSTSRIVPELTPEEKKLLEYKRFRSVIDDIEYRHLHRQFNDDRDRSEYPSYTNFSLPYDWVTWTRYKRNKRAYEKQFQHEINMLINYSGSALDALFFVKHMAITTLWPPYHNPKELIRSASFYHMKGKQRVRLEKIINANR